MADIDVAHIEDISDDEAEATGAKPRRSIWEEIRGLLGVLLLVFLLRTFVFQPFTIPSASMEPGLVEGDYIIVSKFATGYGEYAAWPLPFPFGERDRVLKRGAERGDVIVFRPAGVERDYIKRIVGQPGDTVEVRDHRVFVNGEIVPQNGDGPVFTETLSGDTYQVKHNSAPLPNLSAPDGVFAVPPGFYFVLGDNRDNSLDSRVGVQANGAGLVPSARIVGEAKFVLLSVKPEFSLLRPWTWYQVRGDRWFKGIE